MRVVRRRAGVLLTALLMTLTVGLSGCGPDEAKGTAAAPTPTPTTPPSESSGPPFEDEPVPPIPTDTALQQPKAGSTIRPEATRTAVPGASQLPAPTEAPRTIQGFPVPEGATVKDPGPLDDTWQFDIQTSEPGKVIAFYKRVLPQMGYTVRTDVTYTLGLEKVHWDLAFDGKVSGTMARDPDNGVVFVVVNPPGQKAIAGE